MGVPASIAGHLDALSSPSDRMGTMRCYGRVLVLSDFGHNLTIYSLRHVMKPLPLCGSCG